MMGVFWGLLFILAVFAVMGAVEALAGYVAYRRLRRAARAQERKDRLRAQVARIQAESQARGWVTRAEVRQLMAADREVNR